MEDPDTLDAEVTTGKLLLVEYERLKDEQKGRIGFRDNLLYATLGAMTAVVAATLQAPKNHGLLLLLPPVSVLLGWTYLVNDEKVSAIGRYIREEITPRLAALTAGEGVVFGWEVAHRTDPRRRIRKALQLAIDLATFCLAPLVAVVVFLIDGQHETILVVVSSAEALAVALLAMQIIAYAEIRRDGQGRTPIEEGKQESFDPVVPTS
ncbi:hypothetical protein [Micromonospora sp. NPDC005087]|uniref:hypothetical protein n=1 Tax=Micromonospora sp. NPDC005087 TaxID=3364225 RepID=UPI0036A4D4FE